MVVRMKILINCLAAALFLLLMPVAQADMQKEILHLLQYVENSGCEFERNDSVYDSGEARSHMERKYNYVKSRVNNAEEFIKYAATESSMSGKKYYVTCNGARQTSSEWLHNELSGYRKSSPAVAMPD
jgi:hypothetical protein